MYTMKNLFLSLVATVAISAFAAAQTTFVKMALPKTLQSTSTKFETVTADVTLKYKDGRIAKGEIRLVIPEDGRGLVSAEFSKSIVDGKTISPTFFVDNLRAFDSGSESLLAKCLQGCNDSYTAEDGTKLPGRGKCKFNCWVDAIAGRLIEAIVPALLDAVIKSLK